MQGSSEEEGRQTCVMNIIGSAEQAMLVDNRQNETGRRRRRKRKRRKRGLEHALQSAVCTTTGKRHRAWLSLEQALQSVIQSTDQEGISRQHERQCGRKKEGREQNAGLSRLCSQ